MVIPMGDAYASGTDVLLGLLLATAGVTLVRSPGFRASAVRALGSAWAAVRRPRSSASLGRHAAAVVVLLAFAAWTAASGLWGFHPGYAVAKATGYAGLGLGLAAVGWSGLEWDRALDAWLAGTALTLLVCFLMVALGSAAQAAGVAPGAAMAERALYRGGPVSGLPVPRLRGPFVHPAALGDYLVVSGALLWARWPVVSRLPGGAGWIGAGLLAVAVAWTFSSAWVAAGILLLFWGRSVLPPPGTPGRGWGLLRSVVLRVTGGAVAAVTLAALLFPLRIEVGGVGILSSGIRPRIWTDPLRAFLTDPIKGVGATPNPVDAGDALNAAQGAQLWDAHNAYLSLLGQLGLVGLLLFGGAVVLVAGALRRPRTPGGTPELHVVRPAVPDPARAPLPHPVLRDRARRGLLAALGAMAVHGAVFAGEDLRHWWAVLAVAGAMVATGSPGSLGGRRETGAYRDGIPA